jgi:hypothetical protein
MSEYRKGSNSKIGRIARKILLPNFEYNSRSRIVVPTRNTSVEPAKTIEKRINKDEIKVRFLFDLVCLISLRNNVDKTMNNPATFGLNQSAPCRLNVGLCSARSKRKMPSKIATNENKKY